MTEYYDAENGERIYEHQLYERFDDMLDEVLNEGKPIKVGTLAYAPSRVLKAVDEIAYEQEYRTWLDSEMYDDKRIFEIEGKRYDLCHACACEVVNGDLSGRPDVGTYDSEAEWLEDVARRDGAIELMGNATVAAEGVSIGEFDCWVCGEAHYGDATVFDGEDKA